MALPILDGNQSATTLSTILTGGAHIPAHTVVSLGSQAISDITSAVSGISVSIGGTQTTTFGAVTGSVSVLNFPSTQTVAGTVTANAFGYDSANSTNRQIPILPYNEAVEGMEPYVVPVQISNTFGAVQTGNPLPISGTVTANVDLSSISNAFNTNNHPSPDTGVQISWWDDDADESRLVRPSQPLPVSGTVTANAFGFDDQGSTYQPIPVGLATDGFATNQHAVRALIGSESGSINSGNPLPISGTVTVAQIQGTSVTTSNFTSTTASQTLVSANSARRGLTVFNEGAGNLHICAGATATTQAYQVRLSAGDYWECPSFQTSLTHSAQFSASGTARVVEIL